MPKDRKLIPTIIAAAIFIILEVAALNMLRNNSALQGIWVSKGAHKVMSVLWGGSESIKYYFSLKKQNEALAEENFRLSEQLSRYSKVTAKPDSTFVKVEGFSYIPAEVIKVSRNKQHNYMIINKGYEDGVRFFTENKEKQCFEWSSDYGLDFEDYPTQTSFMMQVAMKVQKFSMKGEE